MGDEHDFTSGSMRTHNVGDEENEFTRFCDYFRENDLTKPEYLNRIPSFSMPDEALCYLEDEFLSHPISDKLQRLVLSMRSGQKSAIVGRWWSARLKLAEAMALEEVQADESDSSIEPIVIKTSLKKTPEQLKELEEVYDDTLYPDVEQVNELVELTGLTYKQIKAWFGNRRKKDQSLDQIQGDEEGRIQIMTQTLYRDEY
jgi:hypothetical protein